jgi:hypothetical protein
MFYIKKLILVRAVIHFLFAYLGKNLMGHNLYLMEFVAGDADLFKSSI